MLTYNDIYEILRKEKYSDSLQPLPKKFLEEFSEYITDKTQTTSADKNLFADSLAKSKKQLENAISIFKELILRRKKKLLVLILVATETGIMKKDYENMLQIEKELFDKLVRAFEETDREMAKTLNNTKEKLTTHKLILLTQNIEQFICPSGKTLGPFKSGELANLEKEIAEMLVSSRQATFVDED